MNEATISEKLERLVDATSLNAVLGLLEGICHEKAEHLRCNWQDENSAKLWDRAAKIAGSASNKVQEISMDL